MDHVDRSEAEPADEVLELTEPAYDTPPEIGTDERRMHVRAYNYWVSLLRGRPFPSVADLDSASLQDCGPQSVLLDFTADRTTPTIVYVGELLRDEGGVDLRMKTIAEVPTGRSEEHTSELQSLMRTSHAVLCCKQKNN